ncbi:unnamed protein product [Cuscuta europaea]|uniref:Uncharacterized protein n=1 Tax=Cuscuta europaea TaxID=41803 RepID=A0A9P1EFH4_CUSEU|nr:unnamed protein product [Cuscuta europaea]
MESAAALDSTSGSSIAAVPPTASVNITPTTAMTTPPFSPSSLLVNFSGGAITSSIQRPESSTLFSNFPPPPFFPTAENYSLFQSMPPRPTTQPAVHRSGETDYSPAPPASPSSALLSPAR